MNAVVNDNAVIGESAIVAAMAFVKARMVVPPRTLVAGIPARVVRELTEPELAWKIEGTRQLPGARAAQPATMRRPRRCRRRSPIASASSCRSCCRCRDAKARAAEDEPRAQAPARSPRPGRRAAGPTRRRSRRRRCTMNWPAPKSMYESGTDSSRWPSAIRPSRSAGDALASRSIELSAVDLPARRVERRLRIHRRSRSCARSSARGPAAGSGRPSRRTPRSGAPSRVRKPGMIV